MTTLKRELRMKIRDTLATYAIDDLEIEMGLTEAVYPFFASKAPEKKGIIRAMVEGQAVQVDMLERVRKSLRLNLEKPTKTNLELIDFLKEKERNGMPLETFATYWTKEHWAGKQGQVPTVNQIVENWYAAFSSIPSPKKVDRYQDVY